MEALDSVRILEVWRALGGPELRRGRAPAFWRSGDNPQAIAVHAEKGCWYDYRDNVGGGVLQLVQHVNGCDQSGALRWLQYQGLIESRTLPRAQRRAHEQCRGVARTFAGEIGHWKSAYIQQLNRIKFAANESGNDAVMAIAAPLCHVLENGSPDDIIREFSRHRDTDPAELARLIAIGEDDEDHSQGITLWWVLSMAQLGDQFDAAA